MTDWEQRQIFERLDKILEALKGLAPSSKAEPDEGPKTAPEDEFVSVEIDVNSNREEESRKSVVAKADRDRYNEYRMNGGTLKWNEWRRKDKMERVS